MNTTQTPQIVMKNLFTFYFEVNIIMASAFDQQSITFTSALTTLKRAHNNELEENERRNELQIIIYLLGMTCIHYT